MNWLFLIEATFSGVFAGYITWLLLPSAYLNILTDFKNTLLAIGIFSGSFIGMFKSISVLLKERRVIKALKLFVIGASFTFAVSTMGTVLFIIITDFILIKIHISTNTIHILWYSWLATSWAISLSIIAKSMKVFYKSVLGLAPAFIIAGLTAEKFFVEKEQYLAALTFTATIASISLAIAYEILKEAWLDEEITPYITYRFFLDTTDYLIGNSNKCDLSLDYGPEKLLCIFEKNGIHSLEIFDHKSCISINNNKFRYKILVDGDIINLNNRKLIYHSRLSRSRDTIPEALAG